MNFNVKQTFFKNLENKVWRFSMHVKHKSLLYIEWIINIKNTRTRYEICLKLTIKTPELFFYCWLQTCICLLGRYLHFYCLDDFHYLDYFHWLHDLPEKLEFGVHCEINLGWFTYQFSYAMRNNEGRGWRAITNDILKLLFLYCNLLLSWLFNHRWKKVIYQLRK